MIATDVLLKLHDWASGEIPTSELPTPKQVAEAFRTYTDLLAALESLEKMTSDLPLPSVHNVIRAAIEKARKEG